MDINSLFTEIKDRFNNCSDFFWRMAENLSGSKFVIFYIGTLCDKQYATEGILKPLIVSEGKINSDTVSSKLAALPLGKCNDTDSAIEKILAGNAVIAGGTGSDFFIIAIEAKSGDGRSISEPDSETVVRGPRQGFIETAEVNVALIRRIIRNTNLKVIDAKCGDLTKTNVKILYYDGVARKDVIDRVIKKISEIKIPTCLDSGYLEQFLQSKKFTMLSEVGNSEKPDKVAGKILGGRVAIICDGSPVVLTVPYLFTESIQSAEDYTKNIYYATFSRLLRFLGMMISFYLPSIYVAILDFHKGALPYSMYKSQSQSRSSIPFDIFTELIIILLIFELIREVALRMPKVLGNSMGIVGGLILGDAAIKAGFASETVIIIAALTSICNFINPTYMNSAVLIRFINLTLAKIFGFFGIAAAMLIMLCILCKKESCGVPFLSPFAPANKNIINDTLIANPTSAIKAEQSELNKFRKHLK